jgi:hypothetical protein
MSVPLAVVLVITVICLTGTVTIMAGIRGWVEAIRIRQGHDRDTGAGR